MYLLTASIGIKLDLIPSSTSVNLKSLTADDAADTALSAEFVLAAKYANVAPIIATTKVATPITP